MTKEELLKRLEHQGKHWDVETGLLNTRNLLIEYINDPEIATAIEQIDKWNA